VALPKNSPLPKNSTACPKINIISALYESLKKGVAPMGRVKDDLMIEEEELAEKQGERYRRRNWRCGICNRLIEEDDESSYMATHYCNYHAHLMEKDD
jgi:DNA-directed RNA polymerase subunit RPC12/RpoP